MRSCGIGGRHECRLRMSDLLALRLSTSLAGDCGSLQRHELSHAGMCQVWSPVKVRGERRAREGTGRIAGSEEGVIEPGESQALMDQWAADRGVRLSSAYPCPCKLLGKHCQWSCAERPQYPWGDHTSLWLGQDGHPRIYVAQPYKLAQQTIDEVHSYCIRRGLVAWFDLALSWHNSGCHMIEIVKAEAA